MSGKLLAKKLHRIESGILGAKESPTVMNLLTPFGYTEEKIEEGLNLLTNACALVAVQTKEYGLKYGATDIMHKEWEKAKDNYTTVLGIARVVFKTDRDLLKEICATGKRSKSFAGWMREARILYTNLLGSTEAVNVMKSVGITAEDLTDYLAEVNKLESKYAKGLECKGSSQQATTDRNVAVEDAWKWFSDFCKIARIALRKKPQLMETLGIVV